MATIKLENLGRRVWHFPVVEMREATPVERYRVVLGDSADRKLFADDKQIVNETLVPVNAWRDGWEPHVGKDGRPNTVEVFQPSPIVHIDAEQFAGEVFPKGSHNRKVLDSLIASGDVRLEESVSGLLSRTDKRLAKPSTTQEAQPGA